MARYISTKISNKQPPISSCSKGDVLVDKTTVAVDTSLAANDVILFGYLPSGHTPVDLTVVADQLDSNGTPTLTLTFGFLNDAGTDLVSGTDFFTTTTAIGRTSGGSFARADKPGGIGQAALTAVDTGTDKGTKETASTATSLLGRTNGDRILAAKVGTAGATKVAGNITANFFYTTK